jgi:hypothetical protein
MVLMIVEKVDPTKYKFGIKPALRLTGFLGFCAGFMLAYQQSSCMFLFSLGMLLSETKAMS